MTMMSFFSVIDTSPSDRVVSKFSGNSLAPPVNETSKHLALILLEDEVELIRSMNRFIGLDNLTF